MVHLIVDDIVAGARADRFLRKHLPQASLSAIYRFLRTGICRVNGKKVPPSYRLRTGDNILIALEQDQYDAATQKGKLLVKKTFDVLYEDDDLLVVNKPPFLASQPGTGVEQHNLIAQVRSYLQNTKDKPALAHRLDRGTSGILIVAKNRKTTLALYKLFKERKVEKQYQALVHGYLSKKRGVLRSYLKKTTQNFQHRALIFHKPTKGAVFAETSYRVLAESPEYSLLELTLKTGKMHQIRAQLAAEGHPLAGDRVYGNPYAVKKAAKMLRRQFLHASRIVFVHPFTKEKIDISAALPADLNAFLIQQRTLLRKNHSSNKPQKSF